MKTNLPAIAIIISMPFGIHAQTSPASSAYISLENETRSIVSVGDTLTFTPFPANTVMTDQYLNKGVMFSGYAGSNPPQVFDYGPTSYGQVLISDNWYNPYRINFTDTVDSLIYHPISRIQFDNPIGPVEVDYISVDAYDSTGVLLYHYMSASPEHVVLNFGLPSVAYIIVDDSANTAYVIDNILIDSESPTYANEASADNFIAYPNPFNDKLDFYIKNNIPGEIIIYDTALRKLIRQEFVNTVTLNTTQLSKGIYIYQVRNQYGIVKQGKVVKN